MVTWPPCVMSSDVSMWTVTWRVYIDTSEKPPQENVKTFREIWLDFQSLDVSVCSHSLRCIMGTQLLSKSNWVVAPKWAEVNRRLVDALRPSAECYNVPMKRSGFEWLTEPRGDAGSRADLLADLRAPWLIPNSENSSIGNVPELTLFHLRRTGKMQMVKYKICILRRGIYYLYAGAGLLCNMCMKHANGNVSFIIFAFWLL